MIGYLIGSRWLSNLGSFLIVAQLTRMSPRLCLALGLSIQAVAGLWMGSCDINLTSNDVMWSNMLHGFGFGPQLHADGGACLLYPADALPAAR